jgi:hypothetical protein
VGVAAAAWVVLGQDEDVLGQRRQQLVTERAAIGRGL